MQRWRSGVRCRTSARRRSRARAWRARSRLAATAVALAIAAVATTGSASELLVGAAVSLREPLSRIAVQFAEGSADAAPALSFGASSTLAMQIRAGAPLDVFVSADERLVDELIGLGLIDASAAAVIAGNRLVVVQRRDAAFPLDAPADLAGPGVRRIAIPEYAVPVGRYARDWLAGRGLLEALSARMLRTEHARATLSAVDSGNADVAIVYATDARLARSARVAFVVPDAEQPGIRYVAAPTAGASDPARAHAFVRFLLTDAARETLQAAGFSDPAAADVLATSGDPE